LLLIQDHEGGEIADNFEASRLALAAGDDADLIN